MIVSRARFPAWMLGAGAMLGVVTAVALGVGSFPVSPGDVVRVLWAALTGGDAGVPDNVRAVVLQIRGPRVLAALAVGAALATAGAAYQNLFRNPLVSPDILGVSGGCALGAVGGILFALPIAAIQGLAFAGGVVAVSLVLAIGAWVRGHDRVLTLVLTGVVVGSLFGAGIAFAKYVADPYNQLPAITFWLLGSFSGTLPRDLAYALPLILIGFVPLVLLRWRMNLLSLPDDEARALGVDLGKLRIIVIVAATLVTSASVAIAGVIGWVGLVIPHAARLLVGAEFARVLPISAVLGAAFMLLVDTLCRTIARTELPPGVLTALVGTPVFIWLLALTFRKSS
ncbi:FecCD family ABC transporter permease [Usitatibacter palustris]|uniref:Putative ABC transporter permease protein n=1 Tax=Usitatibacter palustris TaxID=2732487 RepID=A0A6M4H2N6_9PROT|nr:iron ABC transporter permease [Usitatibacter palustris]QJR13592.1 putative ABC transporter permease protein [Usitatibacter palustris]